MTVFKDFSENGDLIGSKEELLSYLNFSRYIEEKGAGAAEGYLDAITDILTEIDKIAYTRSDRSYSFKTHAHITKGLKHFLQDKEQFRDFVKISINQHVKQKPSDLKNE